MRGIPQCWERSFESVQALTYFTAASLKFKRTLWGTNTTLSQNFSLLGYWQFMGISSFSLHHSLLIPPYHCSSKLCPILLFTPWHWGCTAQLSNKGVDSRSTVSLHVCWLPLLWKQDGWLIIQYKSISVHFVPTETITPRVVDYCTISVDHISNCFRQLCFFLLLAMIKSATGC